MHWEKSEENIYNVYLLIFHAKIYLNIYFRGVDVKAIK